MEPHTRNQKLENSPTSFRFLLSGFSVASTPGFGGIMGKTRQEITSMWRSPKFSTGVIWSAVIPAKAGIHAATMALPLCASPSGLELLGPNESNVALDSRFRGNDCLHRPARKINFPQMTSGPQTPRGLWKLRFTVDCLFLECSYHRII
jgi:hypothetical protein